MRALIACGLTLIILIPMPAFAAMSLGVAAVSAADTNGSTASLSLTGLTAGCGIVAAVMIADDTGGSQTLTSVSDGTNTFTNVGTMALQPTSGWGIQQAFLAASAGGSLTLTATYTQSSGTNALFIAQELCSGAGSGGIALDGTANGAATGANASVSVTTGSNNSAVIGFIFPGADPTAGANYTRVSVAWFDFEAFEYDLDAGTAGPITVDWTNASSNWVMSAAGYKAAASGAAAETFGFRRRLQ